MAKSKIEEAYLKKDWATFHKLLCGYLAYLIKTYAPILSESHKEEMNDMLLARVYETLLERGHDPSRSDFRSYIQSIVRNGVSSYLYRKKKEVCKDEIRVECHDSQYFEFKFPGFDSSYEEDFPEEVDRLGKLMVSILKYGDLAQEDWDALNSRDQNYLRVMFYRTFVEELCR